MKYPAFCNARNFSSLCFPSENSRVLCQALLARELQIKSVDILALTFCPRQRVELYSALASQCRISVLQFPCCFSFCLPRRSQQVGSPTPSSSLPTALRLLGLTPSRRPSRFSSKSSNLTALS